jgi:hypothetical protein
LESKFLKEFDQFSQLFEITPAVSIYHYTALDQEISDYLEEILKDVVGGLSILDTSLDINKLKMRSKPSSCDYAIVSNYLLDFDNSNLLMNMISRSLRDAGYIIILEDKNKNLSKVYELLEEFDYGAVSKIDIFEQYDLIMAKKLHMWGMD